MGNTTSGSSDTTSTQPYIQSGPTVQAAALAGQAQINAAQVAAQAATQNTNSAISALMNEYGTALTYANPTINTGNQAAAQINYMLGLPAVNPGAAPTSPNAPTLQDALGKMTPAQVNQYIQANSLIGNQPGGINPATGEKQDNGNPGARYIGYGTEGSGPNDWWSNAGGSAQFTAGDNTSGYLNGLVQLENDPNVRNEAKQGAAQDYLNQTLTPQYQQQLQAYNQQNAQWQQQDDLYKKYSSMGQATPTNISNIVTNLPGFQFAQEQGINSIENAASASGQLNSGNLLRSLDQFGQGLSQQYYQGYLSNLSGLAGLGQQASGIAQSGATNLGSNIAGMYGNLGNTQANAALAAGQAAASSYLSPVANTQVKMTPYTTTSHTDSTQTGSAMGGISQGLGLLSSIGGMFSSKKLKDSIQKVDTKEILDRVDQLSLDKWQYKGIDREHIGPYAEEFRDLFGVGDGRTINIIDMFGVLVGAVKELHAELTAIKEGK